MNRKTQLLLFVSLIGIFSVGAARAQDEPSAPAPQQGQGRMRGGQEGGRPLFGRITAVHDGSIDVIGQDGQAVTIKLTPQTEFRKDRQAAKAGDFKVGDGVLVRGDQNPDHTVTATLIAGRSGGGGMMYSGSAGGGRSGGMIGMSAGTLGKDYVAGEVKSIDAPKLTVVRSDNVTQVLELNEDTSLRRGRESITMADIKVGDHIMARGAVQNDVFVPKGVMVLSPEQFQRMQQMMSQSNAAHSDTSTAPAQKPQE